MIVRENPENYIIKTKRKAARDRFKKILEKGLPVHNIHLCKCYCMNNTPSMWILFKVDLEKIYEHINEGMTY